MELRRPGVSLGPISRRLECCRLSLEGRGGEDVVHQSVTQGGSVLCRQFQGVAQTGPAPVE